MSIKNDHLLIQQVLDGSIGHERFRAFQLRLRREPALVALYRQYALLHHLLCEEFENLQVSSKPMPLPNRHWPARLAGMAAAAAIALLAAIQWKKSRTAASHAPAYATATFSEDAVWKIEGEQHASGQTVRLTQGAIIRLQQGQARVALESSAVAVIDANTELEFLAGDMLRLGHGRGRFRLNAPGAKLSVATSSLTAVDLGTEFGISSYPGRPDEVHVFEGQVKLDLPGTDEHPVLNAGEAIRSLDRKTIEPIPVSMPRCPEALPCFTPVLEDRFDEATPSSPIPDAHKPLVGHGSWQTTHGHPIISGNRLEGADFELFCKLPPKTLTKDRPILLATMETTEPLHGQFHTDGWAGMSFYLNGKELLFFGDGYGPGRTWSIDVKQGLPIVLPKQPLAGPRTVTLCYNRNTGHATLHEGSLPLSPAFCSGLLPKDMEFDAIRLAASPGAALAIRSLSVHAGQSSQDNP